MDVQEALEFIDDLIYSETGRHLSDLERDVFVGSWENKIYEDIYPTNPEYVEKYVGYKFWQKLSTVLGEKVTKKQFRGALERAKKRYLYPDLPPRSLTPVVKPNFSSLVRVFISYRSVEPDCSLAKELDSAITAAGHQALSCPQMGKDWLKQIDASLQCDYFLLLLSPQAAVSEMVIEELRRSRELQELHYQHKPILLPIRVNCPLELPINHELQNYLDSIPQAQWNSPADTPILVQKILKLIAGNGDWGLLTLDWGLGRQGREDRGELPITPSPSPFADPELRQGHVRLDSGFYVERVPYEAQCYREILQPGTLIRIKAPRQMGKTSLMSRILYHAREQGYRTVPINFQLADKSVFGNLDRLLQWFCSRIARKLKLYQQYPVSENWCDIYGSKDNCTDYFINCLLSQIDTPLALGLDEVDRVFQYPTIADDFFGLLRAWYEEAGYGDSDSGLWEKLRLVVVHSTEVYIPLDVNQSPFNVGLPIELSEFSQEQVYELALRHGLNWQNDEVQQLMQIVGGHPYLVRVALYYICQQQLTLAQLLKTAATDAGIYGDHLRRHLWHLQQHPELAGALQRVLSSDEPLELESILAFKLHSLGLVQLQGNAVTFRFELYRQYFGDRL
ncbi:MAG: AAA-like domain-containing protein [Nostocaceae cyanobacterium]|nr:AAA-like domain-containing protein [Nostocaceae cyanobacterium]